LPRLQYIECADALALANVIQSGVFLIATNHFLCAGGGFESSAHTGNQPGMSGRPSGRRCKRAKRIFNLTLKNWWNIFGRKPRCQTNLIKA